MFCIKCVIFLTLSFLTSSAKLKMEDEVLKVIRITPTVQTVIWSTGSPPRILEEEENRYRVERSAAPDRCHYPKRSNDSEIFCKVYVNRIECCQTCMFGYELNGQQSITLKCYFKENKWKPVAQFQQCQRKINCGLCLETIGNLKCHTRFIKHGPVCEVECYGHGNQKEIGKKKYMCGKNGNWQPKLPHCVKKMN